MTGSRRAFASASFALLVLVAVATPAPAYHTYPVLSTASGPDGGWASFKFTTTGAPFVVRVTGNQLGSMGQWGFFLFDLHANLLLPWVETRMGNDAGALASAYVDPSTGLTVNTFSPDLQGGGWTMEIIFNGPGCVCAPMSGSFRVIAWAAGEFSAHQIELRGMPGTVFLAGDSGDEVFLFDERDFRGPANAQAYGPAEGVAGARATLFGALDLTVTDRLFAFFGEARPRDIVCATGGPPPADEMCRDPVGVHRLHVETPRTTLSCDPCHIGAGEPGEYEFRLTGLDASASGLEHSDCDPLFQSVCASAKLSRERIVVGGADARLP